uniref:Putative secreted protein n=1 Tax=Anopheles triannulatus TaxID=58253 RepID=A0A2M4B6Z0_9DIPT
MMAMLLMLLLLPCPVVGQPFVVPRDCSENDREFAYLVCRLQHFVYAALHCLCLNGRSRGPGDLVKHFHGMATVV